MKKLILPAFLSALVFVLGLLFLVGCIKSQFPQSSSFILVAPGHQNCACH